MFAMHDDTPDSPCWHAEKEWLGQPLDTARLRLRRLEASDAEALLALAGDAEVARWTANIPHPYDLDAAHDFIARAQAASTTLVFAIERRLDGALIGVCGFGNAAPSEEIGYWIGRPFWRQGYAAEALRRMLRLAFRSFDLAELTADILADNAASVRVVEKLGFQPAGTIERELPARGASARLRRFTLARAAWETAQAARPMLLVAAVAMVDVDGRVLIARRPEGKSMAGFWEFPGGKVHAGETPEAALVRELEEELGVDVRESCLAPLAFASHDYDTFHLLMPLYVCRTWKGNVQAREGQALAWVRPARLADHPMPPADIPLVAILRDWL
jgi:8-oxo-dGTP diphosphatase